MPLSPNDPLRRQCRNSKLSGPAEIAAFGRLIARLLQCREETTAYGIGARIREAAETCGLLNEKKHLMKEAFLEAVTAHGGRLADAYISSASGTRITELREALEQLMGPWSATRPTGTRGEKTPTAPIVTREILDAVEILANIHDVAQEEQQRLSQGIHLAEGLTLEKGAEYAQQAFSDESVRQEINESWQARQQREDVAEYERAGLGDAASRHLMHMKSLCSRRMHEMGELLEAIQSCGVSLDMLADTLGENLSGWQEKHPETPVRRVLAALATPGSDSGIPAVHLDDEFFQLLGMAMESCLMKTARLAGESAARSAELSLNPDAPEAMDAIVAGWDAPLRKLLAQNRENVPALLMHLETEYGIDAEMLASAMYPSRQRLPEGCRSRASIIETLDDIRNGAVNGPLSKAYFELIGEAVLAPELLARLPEQIKSPVMEPEADTSDQVTPIEAGVALPEAIQPEPVLAGMDALPLPPPLLLPADNMPDAGIYEIPLHPSLEEALPPAANSICTTTCKTDGLPAADLAPADVAPILPPALALDDGRTNLPPATVPEPVVSLAREPILAPGAIRLELGHFNVTLTPLREELDESVNVRRPKEYRVEVSNGATPPASGTLRFGEGELERFIQRARGSYLEHITRKSEPGPQNILSMLERTLGNQRIHA